MMANIHLLTAGDLRQVTVVCKARLPEYGTWHRALVTCAACLAPPRPPAHASSAPGLTEKAWLAQVRTLAQTHGWMTYHPMRSQGAEPGWVDLVFLRGPTLVCAELKTDRGRLTPAQQRWLDGLGKVEKVQVHLWRPGDLDQVMEVLR
jgi:hypothetical protein